MFISQEKNVGKKSFQKPNILRRKSKALRTSLNIPNINESQGSKPLVTHSRELSRSALETSTIMENYLSPLTKNSKLNLSVANNNVANSDVVQETEFELNQCFTICNDIPIEEDADSDRQLSSNTESEVNEMCMSISSTEMIVSVEKEAIPCKTKWCFDSINSASIDIIHSYDIPQLADHNKSTDMIVEQIPTAILTPVNHTAITAAPNRMVSVELISNKAVKFKCDEGDCNKGFWSEERLRKHKNSHNRQTSSRPPSYITIECPVKKVLDDGLEEQCPRTFQVRRDLLEHLNTDHTPADALYRCGVCGRHFFWAAGLRLHAQSACAPGGLACAWPGCQRVFRLPCRLREHARAHTGDRPYLCRFPECGWAFRSASKLVRHARRHTDERRHACATCGRAFLRREHLRDHVARYHVAAARPTHRCDHAGCEQSFTNMSSLYMHMKKVHRKQDTDSITITPATTELTLDETETTENVYMQVSVVSESSAEWHAARTHCTWPLASRASPASPPLLSASDEANYVLEEDVQVENAEGLASSVYTVRSDLFLHGNVPVDDDSQNMSTEIADSSEAATPLDTDLCLDSHPTIDLMPEGLMYEDAAVDESAFRVFLMNGEELTL